MSACRCRFIVVVLSGWMVAKNPAAAETEAPEIARARGLLTFLVEGQYDKFSDAGEARMKAALSPSQARDTWDQITFKLGKFKAEQSATLTRLGPYDSVRFVCRFERGTLALRIVLNAEGQLSGLWLDAVNPSVDDKPPAYVDKNKFREEKVTVSAGRYELPGTLTIPTAAGPHPAVVLVHGSGPHDEDETVGANKPFRDLAWGLGSRGVAVVRYVKRTKQHPRALEAGAWTLETETIEDACAAVGLLRKRSEIDPRRVFVVGHSLGGWAAPAIAERDGKLAGIVLMAANARPILDLVADQTAYLAKLDGAVSDEEQAGLDKINASLEAIRAGKPEEAPDLFGVPAVYWARLNKVDAVATAAKLDLPILILQGGRDYQVTRKDFALWKERLGRRKNVTLELYDALNHLFVAGRGPSTPQEYQQAGHVDADVVTDIAAWIGRTTSSAPGGKPARKP